MLLQRSVCACELMLRGLQVACGWSGRSMEAHLTTLVRERLQTATFILRIGMQHLLGWLELQLTKQARGHWIALTFGLTFQVVASFHRLGGPCYTIVSTTLCHALLLLVVSVVAGREPRATITATGAF